MHVSTISGLLFSPLTLCLTKAGRLQLFVFKWRPNVTVQLLLKRENEIGRDVESLHLNVDQDLVQVLQGCTYEALIQG